MSELALLSLDRYWKKREREGWWRWHQQWWQRRRCSQWRWWRLHQQWWRRGRWSQWQWRATATTLIIRFLIAYIVPQTAELWGSYHALPNRIRWAGPPRFLPRCPAVPGGARCMQKPKEKQCFCGARCKNQKKNDTGEDPKQHVFGYNAGNNVKKEKNEHLRAKG